MIGPHRTHPHSKRGSNLKAFAPSHVLHRSLTTHPVSVRQSCRLVSTSICRSQDESVEGATSDKGDSQNTPSASPPAPSAFQSKEAANAKRKQAATTASSDDTDKIIQDPELRKLWAEAKITLKTSMSKDTADMWDQVEIEDVMKPNQFLGKMLDASLRPVLESMGVEEEPVPFFLGLCQLAIAFQLLSGSALFLGLDTLTDLNKGEVLRCTLGLLLGYASRPFFSVEQLLWPIYQAVLRVVSPNMVYEVSATPAARQATLNRLGIAIAALFFIPQALFGWKTDEAVQFVGPLTAGWLLFDFSFLLGLLVKLR